MLDPAVDMAIEVVEHRRAAALALAPSVRVPPVSSAIPAPPSPKLPPTSTDAPSEHAARASPPWFVDFVRAVPQK